MRGLVADLTNPYPLVASLPAVYQGDAFTERLLSAFDDALAPLLLTLDNLEAYLDPATAPPDFLPWLAGWVGITMDDNWSIEQRRRLVAEGVALLAWRGTRRGVVDLIRSYLGVPEEQVEVTDTGGVAWSATPDGTPPGSETPAVVVRVRVDEPGDVDRDRLEHLMEQSVPAHVATSVEVVGS